MTFAKSSAYFETQFYFHPATACCTDASLLGKKVRKDRCVAEL